MSTLGIENIEHTNGTSVATVASDGKVSFPAGFGNTPSTPNRPAFIATRHGSDQTGITGSASSPTTMIFTDTSAPFGINTGNHYNTSTGIFTAPVAGIYFFCFSVLINSVDNSDDQIHISMVYQFASGSMAGQTQLHFFSRTNGEAANGTYGYGGYLPWNGSIMFNMLENDTVKMAVGSNGNIGLYNDRSQNRFQGFLVG